MGLDCTYCTPSSSLYLLYAIVVTAPTKQEVVGVAFVLEHQSTEADVTQVLEPLKIRYGHTARVDVYVGKHKDLDTVTDQLLDTESHLDACRQLQHVVF